MYYTTSTTTAAPVWANTWAIMPELPTTTATAPATKRESHAARLWATLKDYAAGTWDGIRNRTRRAADKTRRAAATIAKATRRLLGVLLLVFGCLSTFALFVLILNVAADHVPFVLALRLLLVIPAAAVAFGYEYAYIKTFGTLNHYAHLLDEHGGNCPRW